MSFPLYLQVAAPPPPPAPAAVAVVEEEVAPQERKRSNTNPTITVVTTGDDEPSQVSLRQPSDSDSTKDTDRRKSGTDTVKIDLSSHLLASYNLAILQQPILYNSIVFEQLLPQNEVPVKS